MNSINSSISDVKEELIMLGYTPNSKQDDCLVYKKHYQVTSARTYPTHYALTVVFDLREHTDKIIRVSGFVDDADKYMDDFDVWMFNELDTLRKITNDLSYDVINDVW